MSVRHHTLRSPSAEACITEFAAALPSSSSPPPENISQCSSFCIETMTNVNQGMSVEEIERVITIEWLMLSRLLLFMRQKPTWPASQ
ncbi:hypothetical protein Tco_0580330 [Tanacetum coccineum]